MQHDVTMKLNMSNGSHHLGSSESHLESERGQGQPCRFATYCVAEITPFPDTWAVRPITSIASSKLAAGRRTVS
eukprot:scaffold81484_cov31-Tisochrysis_lutea.AAC.15